MAYRRNYRPRPKDMVIKYAGSCACCGARIEAGAWATYYPAGTIAGIDRGSIAHVGGLEGTSPTCAGNIRQRTDLDPGFVDLDRAYEDSCSDIVGR